MPSILVVGYHEHDAGKTILTGSLVSILRGRGVDAVAVKPMAGVDLWESPWVLNEIKTRGLVVSGDALKLAEASGGGVDPEVLNPVSLIYAPVDPSKVQWRPRIGEGNVEVLGRVSLCREDRVDTMHFINVEALNLIPNGLASSVLEAGGRLKPYPFRASRELVEKVVTGGFTAEIESCMSKVYSSHELVVVESNSDVAVPTPSSLGAEWVLVSGRGVVAVVEGERWAKAVEVLAGTGGVRALTARDVLSLTGVKEVFQLPFLVEPIEGYSESDLDPLLSYILGRSGRLD